MIETKVIYRQLKYLLTKEVNTKEKEMIKLKYSHFCNLCGYEFNWGAISEQPLILKMRNEIDSLIHRDT